MKLPSHQEDMAFSLPGTIAHPEPSPLRSMPPASPEGPAWPAPLGRRIRDGATAEDIADAVVGLWLEIDQVLHPILGHRGVAALYNRSLKLAARAHPWLGVVPPGALSAVDPSALKAVLVQQSVARALAGGDALFRSFRGLLTSLVGASLTERLLQSVWAQPPGDSPAQDTSS